MATYATLTVNAEDIIGADFDKHRASAWIEAGGDDGVLEAIKVDGTNLRVGGRRESPAPDGTITFSNLVTTNSAANPTSFFYRVRIVYTPKGSRRQGHDEWTSAWFPLTGNANLANIDAAFDNLAAPVSWRSDFIDQAQALLEQQELISGLTGEDAAIANRVNTAGSATDVALRGRFGRKRAVDVRDHGAACNGTTDDTAAIQAAINAAGDFGVVAFPPLDMKVSAPIYLRTGTELRGADMKSTRFIVANDTIVFVALGGGAQALRNFKILHTYSGPTPLTQFVIEMVSPTKPVLEDIEIDIQVQGSGIRFRRDEGVVGNSFMPMLSRVWIRQGTLVIDGVTDGHFVDGYVWAQDNNSAAIRVIGGHLWTFVSVDLVPSDNAGTGYLFENVEGAQITGGYCDGSYLDNPTGYGIRAINSRRILVSSHQFFSNGRSGIQLENSHGCTFTACGFHGGNKQNNSYPDINLVGSTGNTFLGTVHAHPGTRTNPGGVYREDTASTGNVIDYASMDTNAGITGYHSDLFVGRENTPGDSNRPRSLWQKNAGAPDILQPPVTLLALGTGAVAWPAANSAIFHRFTVMRGAPYRYVNFRVEGGSGNMQATIVRLSGSTYTSYTRVKDSGIIACTTGDKNLDLGTTFLDPGEYAVALWCDSATATFRVISSTPMVAMRQSAYVTSLASGVPGSGSIGANWGSTFCIGGLNIGVSI